ncbi:MAG: VanZ family protein [Anaerolineaceae bacterium]|nr:VanZ family protein [Anaerolineaceae bacterium]
MNKRWGFLVLIVIVVIFYLTFQSPSQTMGLSEGVRGWLASHGIVLDSSTIRSNAHLPEYILLGISLCLFVGWKKALLFGPLVGIIDEVIRIPLPTRHFDIIDLLKDFAGVFLGVLLVVILKKITKK